MNTASLFGRITFQPELKFSRDGKGVLKFTLAVRRDKENVDFIKCVAFGNTAELIANNCKKGDRLTITGPIRVSQWQKDGERRETTEVHVVQFNFIEPKHAQTPQVTDPWGITG